MSIEDGLDKLLLGLCDEALEAFEACEPSPQAEKLHRLAQKLSALSSYAAALSRGDLAVKPPDISSPAGKELCELHTNLKRLARHLLMASTGYPVPPVDYMGDLSEGLRFLLTQSSQKQHQEVLGRDYDTDTGLLNRKALIRGVFDVIQSQPGKVGVLLCYGLDNLKYINLAHGYAAGDLYINRVVEALLAFGGGTSIVARVGGNEFAVYAHGFDDEKTAFGFAQSNLLNLFKTQVALPHEEVKVRASCGVAIYPHDAVASDTLMNYASQARFEVQKINRGTIMRFSPELYRAKANLLSRQERLDELIEEKLFYFDFQPIVDLKNNSIFGYEALMRPKTSNFTGPLDILSLAEAQSKLQQLEKATFAQIFNWISQNLALLDGRKIFFNTISTDYLDIASLQEIHPQYEAISKHMVFEILETVTAESMLLEKVNALRNKLSALIAIDDFGCGHSNALRLINIAPDILKIDRFFISSIHNAAASKNELLANILGYCRARKIQTLAEGVETSEELACVVAMGFDYAQGYYIGRPQAPLAAIEPAMAAEITELIAKHNSSK